MDGWLNDANNQRPIDGASTSPSSDVKRLMTKHRWSVTTAITAYTRNGPHPSLLFGGMVPYDTIMSNMFTNSNYFISQTVTIMLMSAGVPFVPVNVSTVCLAIPPP